MTLQQLRYLVAIVEYGSINAAAKNLYASQSNFSTAVKELETEFGIRIFNRNNRGVTLTNEGAELLSYARQVIEQADMLESRYQRNDASHARLAVSTQHYAFSVQAFIKTADQCDSDRYEFVLRETATSNIIEDVKTFRSDIGILFIDSVNQRVLEKAFEDATAVFHPLFEASVHVFVSESHPLASKELLTLDDLKPWPRYAFEQGAQNSFYFAEEPLANLVHARTIRMTDRGTLTNLLTSHDGYTLSTGVLSPEMHSGIASIPLDVDEPMRVGYLTRSDRKPSDLLASYIDNLKAIIRENPNVDGYLGDNEA